MEKRVTKSKFEVGQIVQCVEPSFLPGRLVKGELYRIVGGDLRSGYCDVTTLDGARKEKGWLTARFVPAPAPEWFNPAGLTPLKNNSSLKPGDLLVTVEDLKDPAIYPALGEVVEAVKPAGYSGSVVIRRINKAGDTGEHAYFTTRFAKLPAGVVDGDPGTVPSTNINLKAEPKETTKMGPMIDNAPFKVGDKVKCIKEGSGVLLGETYEITNIKKYSWDSDWLVKVAGQPTEKYAKRFVKVDASAANETGTYILISQEGGKFLPAANPKVYTSQKQAKRVALDMAEKHPGTEFFVFKATAKAKIERAAFTEL
jgi:hypothetical protein